MGLLYADVMLSIVDISSVAAWCCDLLNCCLCDCAAIQLLKDKPPGSFVVRNSSSFQGSFGLAVKVAQLPPNVQVKGGLYCNGLLSVWGDNCRVCVDVTVENV